MSQRVPVETEEGFYYYLGAALILGVIHSAIYLNGLYKRHGFVIGYALFLLVFFDWSDGWKGYVCRAAFFLAWLALWLGAALHTTPIEVPATGGSAG